MNDLKVKTTAIPLPTGYRGLTDIGNGRLEYCDALFAFVYAEFDADGNVNRDIGISYRDEIGFPLDYVVTPTGKVTNGDITWSNLKEFLKENTELSLSV